MVKQTGCTYTQPHATSDGAINQERQYSEKQRRCFHCTRRVCVCVCLRVTGFSTQFNVRKKRWGLMAGCSGHALFDRRSPHNPIK